MKISTELKKVRQEFEHAEKMVVKWTDKCQRKSEKLIELENLHMIDFLRKNKVGIDELPDLVANLPSLGINPEEDSSDEEPVETKGNKESKEEQKDSLLTTKKELPKAKDSHKPSINPETKSYLDKNKEERNHETALPHLI